MVDTEIDSVTQERKRNIGKERGEERRRKERKTLNWFFKKTRFASP